MVESEPRRAVARRDGGFSVERLYIDNISSVNRVLAIFDEDCQDVAGDASSHAKGSYTSSSESSVTRAGMRRHSRCPWR